MRDDEKDLQELGDLVQGQADGCFRRSAESGPTAEGARWLLLGSILYSTAIAMKQRPDRLEDMAIALHGVLRVEPRNFRRMLAEVRKKISCN